MSWNEVKHRYYPIHVDRGFWACVDKDGYWFDSSESYPVAVHWGAVHTSTRFLDDGTIDEELKACHDGKVSIIHSSLLQQMADAGLIK